MSEEPMHDDSDQGDGHSHQGGHDHQHGHGHENDQGLKAMLRYLRWAPQMLFSDLNRAIVDQLAPQPGERVADIGAGMGPGVVYAAKAGAEVLAVEPTPFMRRILSARRLLQRSRARIVIGDGSAEKIPAADGSIDGVMAVNTMHHWVDLEAGVSEIRRVLKPGGRVVMVDEDFQNPEHPDFGRFGGASGDDEDDHDHHGFTLVEASKMGDLLRSTGLVDVVAGDRSVAGRPVISVTATRAP